MRPVGDGTLSVTFAAPQRRIAPGQTVALYDAAEPDAVVGSGIAAVSADREAWAGRRPR